MGKKLEEKALWYLKEIEKRGGMISCIESGFIQKEIQEAAYRTQLAMDQSEQLQVGVNCFQVEETEEADLLKIDQRVQDRQIRKIKKFKAARNAREMEKTRAELRAAAKSSQNLMPFIVSAVKAHVSLGEVSDDLRSVFGTHREILTI